MTPRPRVLRLGGAGVVTAGSLLANIAAYLLHLPASRWLGPVGYGEFAALLSAQLLIAVPALALQAVVARECVRGAATAALRALGARTAALVALVSALAVPAVAWLLDTSTLTAAAALLAGPLLCLLATEQGLLQGRERFAALGMALAAAGVGKVAPALGVLALGGQVGVALAAGAAGVGAVWAAMLGWAHVRKRQPADQQSPLNMTTGAAAPLSTAVAATTAATTSPLAPGVGAVIAAGQVQLVMMALTSIDLLLARALLSPADAGRYALGAVAAKAAFWLPQAVGTVLYPRMADPSGHRGAVRSAVAVLTILGGVLVGAAALGAPLVPLLVGEAYRPVVGLLWAFAALGVVLSILQALLLAAIAADRTWDALYAWAGLLAIALTIWWAPREVGTLLAITIAGGAVITSTLAVRAFSR